ncbi:MAG TPA: enoyl-CoA hydratase-related protein [Calditrichia bacterium]|nr:enoyl-CoA hydratase/isomerase family protein [Calditrichota bacterium]HQU71095.1 enoyl-CoA hydratase-related protein [Calditrichia bacterium]HQV30250.1 enoyl-CoA hydratase-related protein [Calditrichia bacterium]
MSEANLLLSHNEGVATLTINRPTKLNALNKETLDELGDRLQELREDPAVRAIIITGNGEKAFVAGADISQFPTMDRRSGQALARHGQAIFNKIEQMPKPVIAAVNGFALGGGCELAMACHFRIASQKALFGQPEINLGIIPGYGGTQRLPRLIGKEKALYLLLTGDHLTAEDALKAGLVDRVVPAEELMNSAGALAAKLAAKAPLAVGYILQAVYQGADRELDEALDLEADLFGDSFDTEDMKEGTTAFLEKRKPQFKGK